MHSRSEHAFLVGVLTSLVLLGIGLFGLGVALRGVARGEISMVWSSLGGWGRLVSSHDRDEDPIAFWATTIFYAAAGLVLALLGAYRLFTGG